MIAQVDDRRPCRRPTVADFGAGKSPVPIALANLGLRTSVVDPDSQRTTGRRVGGEWDWTHYGPWGVDSLQAGLEDEGLFPADSLGFAVSVSVIEHVPASTRRLGLKNLAHYLEPAGFTVMTVDLTSGTRRLWNRALAMEVEEPERHGDVDDLLAEAAAVGLQLEQQTQCPFRTSDVDVLGLVFRRA